MSAVEFTKEERVWLRLKWDEVRKANALADESNGTWKRINAEINQYLDRQDIKDVVQRNKIKSASLPLADALGTGKWHSGNAQRHCDDIQTFLRLRELGVI